MKTKLHPENPFGPHPKGFLWEVLHRRGRRPYHMDYGAHDGSMLRGLKLTGVIDKAVGFDANAEVVRKNAPTMPENVELRITGKNPVFDLPDESFDSISIIGVLEHIYDQKHILRQFHRLLRPDGVLVVAVPGKHLFSFLDMGNWKFVFPRTHRFFYERRYSKEQYHARYIECRNGLIGDIEKEKAWHQHFSQAELAALLSSTGFEVTDRDGFGYFNRPIVNLMFFMPGPLKRALARLVEWDARAFNRAEIFVSARKVPDAASRP